MDLNAWRSLTKNDVFQMNVRTEESRTGEKKHTFVHPLMSQKLAVATPESMAIAAEAMRRWRDMKS